MPSQRGGDYRSAGGYGTGSYADPDSYRPFGADTGSQAAGRDALPPAPDVFGRRKASGRKRWPVWARTLLVVGICFAVLLVVQLFFFQAISVRASSMSPTLQAGDRVLVNKVVYDFRSPHRGEIILFHGDAPTWTPDSAVDHDSGAFASIGSAVGRLFGFSSPSEDEFFRRVIATPGDTIACCDVNHHVTVNGRPLNETYVHNDSPMAASKNAPACGSRQFAPVVVSPGSVFVMGDNRVASLDSRCVAQVPFNRIVGRATAVIIGRWASLSVPKTFNDVPKPYGLGDPNRQPVRDEGGLVVVLPLITGFATRRAFRPVTDRRRRSLRA